MRGKNERREVQVNLLQYSVNIGLLETPNTGSSKTSLPLGSKLLFMPSLHRTEQEIGRYIVDHYRNVVEIGVGNNFEAARVIHNERVEILCTDIGERDPPPGIRFVLDDVTYPSMDLYQGADCIFAIRPGEEMMLPLIALASGIGADLLVYHLGFEMFGDGGEIIDLEKVVLHRYVRRKRV
jgi:uncharacterized UPF0146 family protein